METENSEQFKINELIERIKVLEERIDALEKHKDKINISSLEDKGKPKISDILSTTVECKICHKMYKNKYILATHMIYSHGNDRGFFEYPYCIKKLKSKYYLNKLIHSFHEDNDTEHDIDAEETLNSFLSENTADV